MEGIRFYTSDPSLPFWLSAGYRKSLIRDSLECLLQSFRNIKRPTEAAASLVEGLRLLRRYFQKRIQCGNLLKRESVWEVFNTAFPNVVVEVGSFDGLDALEFSRMFPSAKVFAFEADPRNFRIVKKNVAIRKLITPVPKAVFDVTGQGTFHPSNGEGPAEHTRASGSMLPPAQKFLGAFPNMSFNEEMTVDTVSLFDWAQQNSIAKIDFLWMDAQGAELHILKGMGELLHGVQAILLEVWTQSYYQHAALLDEIRDFLQSFGFVQTHLWLNGDAGDALFQKCVS